MTATFGERQPPHNFEAEQALLGAILVNNSAWLQASEIVRPEHFADPLHSKLFEVVGRQIERGLVVTALTLKAYAEADEGLKVAGGAPYLARLMGASVHALDAPQVAALVRDCATRRRLIGTLNKALAAAYDEGQEASPAEQIEALEQQLYEIADNVSGGGVQPFHSALAKAVKSAEAAHSEPGGMPGITTGLRDLDEVLGGLHRSDLVILAGRPGMGKSALATNIAFAAAHHANVAFFSLEMSAEQLATRIVAEQARVPSEKLRRGQLANAELDSVFEIVRQLEALPLFMDDTAGLSVATIRTRARRMKRQQGLGLVIIDYLQLIDGGKRRVENRVQEVSEITRGLKQLAKELDVPVLALSQLSRAVEQRPNKRPQLADLRESGSIEQDADVVMFIYREEYYLERGSDADRDRIEDVAGKAEVHLAKHRHGPTGVAYLRFDGATTCFSDEQGS